MSTIYVKILKIDGFSVTCCMETAVLLFIYKYLQYENDEILLLSFILDLESNEQETVLVDVENINFECKTFDIADLCLKNCHFPIYSLNEHYCISGFCAVIRQVRHYFF